MAKKNPGLAMASAVKDVQKALDRIAEIREELNSVKALYAEHDILVEDVLPLFIEMEDDKFIIHRSIKLGSKTYTLSPFFFDEKKGKLLAKVWKSTAFGTVAIG
jgi:hypothetical protein